MSGVTLITREHNSDYNVSPCLTAIRNLSGHYYLNGDWKIDFPKPLKFVGTYFHYERRPPGFYGVESITALGPITESLYIVVSDGDSSMLEDEMIFLPF